MKKELLTLQMASPPSARVGVLDADANQKPYSFSNHTKTQKNAHI